MARLCDTALVKFFYSLSSYHELIGIANYIRPMMAAGLVNTEIFNKVKSKGSLIRSSNGQDTYGLNAAVSNEVSQSITSMRETDAGLALLPASILLSLVATFDSIIGDAVKGLLRIKPDRVINSEKTLTLRELFRFDNVEQAKEHYIDDEVDKLLRGSHQSQVDYIEKLIGTKIVGHYSRWPNFIEVFERRNVVAHVNGQASNTYVRNCKAVGLKIDHIEVGSQLTLKQRYLHKAVDYLTEFGVLFSFVMWRKLDPDTEGNAFGRLNDLALDAIKRRRYDLAVWLLDFALHKQTRNAPEVTIRMMFINLANAYKKSKNEKKSQEVLAELDWTATSDLFNIAIASLNGDIMKTSALLTSLAASGTLTAEAFRDWPIFDWVRGEAAIAESFERAFGENLAVEVTSKEPLMSDDAEKKEEESTVH